jgi:hypothetical protein
MSGIGEMLLPASEIRHLLYHPQIQGCQPGLAGRNFQQADCALLHVEPFAGFGEWDLKQQCDEQAKVSDVRDE